MDREKLINRIRRDRISLVHIPSTSSDQERKKLVQDFTRQIEQQRLKGEAIILYLGS
jgi:hypothetical protein